MQDRPTAEELLEAIEQFLDGLVPELEGSRSFHTRVAANAVRIVRREIEKEDRALAEEWAELDSILGAEERPAGAHTFRKRLRERNEELCARIQRGDFDEGEAAERVRSHARSVVRAKLEVSDPRLLERRSAGF